jgi:hypothetical protein
MIELYFLSYEILVIWEHSKWLPSSTRYIHEPWWATYRGIGVHFQDGARFALHSNQIGSATHPLHCIRIADAVSLEKKRPGLEALYSSLSNADLKMLSFSSLPFISSWSNAYLNTVKIVPILNQLSTTPWRRMGEWMYTSIFSWAFFIS